MSIDLSVIMGQIGRDKGIDKTLLVEAVESAMLSAAKRHYGHGLNLEASFNEESGEVEVLQFKTVVDAVEDPNTQVTVAEARESYDPDAMVGDELGQKLDTTELGRIAAQTAKQVIAQKLRDAERGVIFEEYKDSKGEIVNGIVQRYERGNLVINLGRTEAVLPKREQISRERYRQGDRLRAMILDIDRAARGPQIVLTRSHPEFLKKLFALEVPEIADGMIEIKAVAREPGERAKIAVHSTDSSVDPVGACVGIKGSRVQAVVLELRGERVDIVTWTPDEPSFVARALAPAEVSRVVVDEEEHSIEVVVADDQLSLAIGRRGQNVKLASKLTGWRLDVRSVSVAEEESKRARQSLENIAGIDFTEVEMLFQNGFRNPKQVSQASLEELMEIKGLGQETAQRILDLASTYVESLPKKENEWEEEEDSEEMVSELNRLGLSPAIRECLERAGYWSIQSLVAAIGEEGFSVKGLEEADLATVKMTLDSFLKGNLARVFN
jgi:N utilization substance protein A